MEFNIKRLKEKSSENAIYPQTVGLAVYLENGNSVEREIGNIKDAMPTKTSDLANDSGFINDVSDKADKNDLGDVRTLNTDTKNNVVEAINEVISKVPIIPDGGTEGQVLVKSKDGLKFSDRDYVFLDIMKLSEPTYNVTRSIDRNGEPYRLRDIVVFINNMEGINGGANSYAYIYDESDERIIEQPLYFYAPAAAISSRLSFSHRGACVFMESSGWTSASYSPTTKSYMEFTDSNNSIAKISISSNGGSFKAGTEFIICGVKA